MRVGAVVQARMSSQRLPGKVLGPLAGRPLLGWLLDRLDRATTLDVVVVATSDRPEDDAIAAFCADRGTACWRGSLDDVAGRILGAAASASIDLIVRVNADSPLVDPGLVDRAVSLWAVSRPEVVTNVLPRSYPKGLSVEVLTRAALDRAHGEMTRPDEREHVTRWFYERAGEVRIEGFGRAEDRSTLDVSVDDPDGATRVERILLALGADALGADAERVISAIDDVG